LPNQLPRSYNYRYVICALIFSGYVLVFFQRLCPAVLALDIQAAFGVGGTLLGVLASAYFYPYALMQLPTGLLVDLWGPRHTASIFFWHCRAGRRSDVRYREPGHRRFRARDGGAGGVLSMFALSLIFGSPLLGWVANRLGRKVVLIGCSSLLLVCLGLYLFMTRLNRNSERIPRSLLRG